MKLQSATPLFIFLLLAISPAYAFPTLYSNSITMDSNGVTGFQCINTTVGIRCYYETDGGGCPSNFPQLWIFNETGGVKNACRLGASCGINYNGLAILNETYAYLTAAGTHGVFYLFNITNLSLGVSTNCAQVSTTTNDTLVGGAAINGGGAGAGGSIVWVPSNLQISPLFAEVGSANLSSPYNYTSVRTATYPNASDATTYWVAGIGTSNNMYQLTNGALTDTLGPPTNYWTLNSTSYQISLLKFNASTTYAYMLAPKTANSWNLFVANFSAASSQNCNWDGEILGTVCKGDVDNATYTINRDNCNITTTSCPTGTFCEQVTPVLNVSSALVEDYTSCQITTNGGFKINCFNICFNNVVIGGNCVDAGCKKCPNSLTGTITYGGIEGYFTTTWYTNQSSIAVPDWTIACVNANTMKPSFFIDQNGTNTTEVELLTRAGNNVSLTPFTNLSVPTSDVSSSGAGWFALSLGSLFGITDLSTSQWIFSMIVALGVGFALLYYTKGGEHGGQAFIFGTLAPLILFSLIGWFPGWVMILLIVAGAFLVARSIGVGG